MKDKTKLSFIILNMVLKGDPHSTILAMLSTYCLSSKVSFILKSHCGKVVP